MTDLLVRHHDDYGLPMYTTENGGASRLRFARTATWTTICGRRTKRWLAARK